MDLLLDALRRLGLRGHLSPSGRLLILAGRRGRAFVAQASGERGFYVWCEQPDDRAVEHYADPVEAIRAGLRRASRGGSERGRRATMPTTEQAGADTADDRAPTKRVLVVDGSLEILDLLRILLEEEGYGVALASSPDRALDEARRRPPDLIVLEAVFGDEPHGLRLLEALGRDPATAPIPVVLCSGAVELVRGMPGELAARLAGVVLKPFDIDELLRAVEAALQSGGTSRGNAGRTVRGGC